MHAASWRVIFIVYLSYMHASTNYVAVTAACRYISLHQNLSSLPYSQSLSSFVHKSWSVFCGNSLKLHCPPQTGATLFERSFAVNSCPHSSSTLTAVPLHCILLAFVVFVLQLEYEKAMKNYHASPSYQAYLNAKTKGEYDPLYEEFSNV